ncbi:MAG: UDP-N-acetylmuramoyl-tripeptide--D-alanyl-D-alanine ligase [Lentisphaeria bacterium]|nr:UDP-N-acetylmuramoyl-tripeptide--D-alanyl-D-alanine ligase [Lentisphaeria bacterium]
MNPDKPRFTPEELLAATDGVWQGEKVAVTGVFTDTRVSAPGALFAALAGERFDAHNFLDKAVAAGAAVLCVERSKAHLAPAGVPLLLVEDTLEAYQRLSAFHRRRFKDLTVFGITGSVGKTSVKEMLRAICTAAAGSEEKVLWTLENTNNQIGVPQNLFRLHAGHRYAVLEAGTNHFGEIAPLGRCIAPDVALVNSVAPCHLEFLRDLEGVAEEKSHICDALVPGGTAVFPAESPQLEILKKNVSEKIALFGGEKGDVRCVYLGGTLRGSRVKLIFPGAEEITFDMPLSGAHQAMNAAAAAAAAFSAGIDIKTIASGLAATLLPGGRNRIYRSGEVICIDDTYNANPAAVTAALKNLKEFAEAEKLVLLLGEMRELGAASSDAHAAVRRCVEELFPGVRLLLVGKSWGSDAYPDSDSVKEAVAEVLRPGDILFAKGSRGVALEKALPPADGVL